MSEIDLFTCLDDVRDAYLTAEEAARPSIPALAESREMLRLFNAIGDDSLRGAVLNLLRSLAWLEHESPSSGPIAPPRPAANTRG